MKQTDIEKKHSPTPILGYSPEEEMAVPGKLATSAQQTAVVLTVEKTVKNFEVCCSFLAKQECVTQHPVPETKKKHNLSKPAYFFFFTPN